MISIELLRRMAQECEKSGGKLKSLILPYESPWHDWVEKNKAELDNLGIEIVWNSEHKIGIDGEDLK
jgi:hypothetical protein